MNSRAYSNCAPRRGRGSCENKAPAIPFRIRGVSGGTDAELQIADRKASNGNFANGDLSDRTFAVIGKPVVVRSHQEGAADWRAPAARDDSPARFNPPAVAAEP